MPSKGDGSTAKALKKLASESPREEFELDLGSILEELKDWKKENPGKDEMDFYKEKGITIKRIELDKGGVVISLSDYLKQKEKPKIKKIDLAQGDFEKTVAGLSDSDKATIKDLLRKSGILVGDYGKAITLTWIRPTRKPDALPPKTETVIKLNNGGTASKRIEDQPGYDYEKDPNILRRLKYITRTFDDNDIGNSLDAAIDKEDIELKN